MDYQTALAMLQTARDPEAGKPIANNTRLFARPGGAIAVRLHSTDVVTFQPDGRVVLNSGGWLTVTTKARMNEYAGLARIYSDRGTWTVYPLANPGWNDRHAPVDWNRKYPYADGVTLHPDGSVTGAGEFDAGTQARQLRKDAGKYARDYVAALYAGDISAPGAGDCFFCHMHDVSTGRPIPGGEHIRSHMEEAYFVPSLVWNALERFGGSIAARQAVRECQSTGSSAWAGIVRDQLTRIIRRYVIVECGGVA